MKRVHPSALPNQYQWQYKSCFHILEEVELVCMVVADLDDEEVALDDLEDIFQEDALAQGPKLKSAQHRMTVHLEEANQLHQRQKMPNLLAMLRR
jgi:hypothetical protein